MPTWGAILAEFRQSALERGDEGPDSDGIRLKYIRKLHELSGRAVIVYTSGWLKSTASDPAYSVEGADIHGLMENCYKVPEHELDLIIHSPGGSPTAAEQMIDYLRTQFDYIRAIVPLQAKSAATMMALGCDEVVLGLHSELGPIDPQILIQVPEGARYAPAHAIIRDFKRAQSEIAKDVSLLASWTPILRSYTGGFIDFCTQQIALSRDVVARWLERYMLSHDDVGVPLEERGAVAKEIADYFGSEDAYDRFRTHSRPVRIEELSPIRGLRLRKLEDDGELQDAALSIYHSVEITHGYGILKIIENHLGSRYVRIPRGAAREEPSAAPRKPALPLQRPSGGPPKPRGKKRKK